MTGGIQTAAWGILGHSFRGASHRRWRLPNQDALAWAQAGDSGVVAGVADGHGSSACFRSGTGAELAVRTAIDVGSEFLNRCAGKDSAAVLAEAQSIPETIAWQWRAAVVAHVTGHPVPGGTPDPPFPAYGTTVLAAVATGSYIVCAQLGDGDILVVSAEGEVKRLWPRDPRLFGVETTSLCGLDAAAEMRIAVEYVSDDSPALVLLATDGYANSFRDDRGFLQIGRDLLEIIREEGIQQVEQSLETWLSEASELGSGDDITLAVLYRATVGVGCDGH